MPLFGSSQIIYYLLNLQAAFQSTFCFSYSLSESHAFLLPLVMGTLRLSSIPRELLLLSTLKIRRYVGAVFCQHCLYTLYSIFHLNRSEEYKQSETLSYPMQHEKVLNPDLADSIGSLSQLSYGPILLVR